VLLPLGKFSIQRLWPFELIDPLESRVRHILTRIVVPITLQTSLGFQVVGCIILRRALSTTHWILANNCSPFGFHSFMTPAAKDRGSKLVNAIYEHVFAYSLLV
jgi:hypothetical protein